MRAETANLRSQLLSLAKTKVPLHYCIRDIHGDHVLFEADNVSGIIDYGACRVDEGLTDAVRLLGSLEPNGVQRWNQALQTYWLGLHADRKQLASPHASFNQVLERAQIMDRVATLLTAVQWMDWLCYSKREFALPRTRLVERWASFIQRLNYLDFNE